MNKVILMGRLTRDPELRYASSSNVPVCSFTLAVDRRFTRQGEERQTDFIPVVTFGKTAEFCKKYFSKGMQVCLAGRIQVRSYNDSDGKRRYVTEVLADEVQFADSRRGGQDAPDKEIPAAPEEKDGDGGFMNVDEDDNLPF